MTPSRQTASRGLPYHTTEQNPPPSDRDSLPDTDRRRILPSFVPPLSSPRTTMATAPQTFTALPILPLSHARDPATKPAFLAALRDALLNVGFLYLSETGLPDGLVRDVVKECVAFFETLPVEEKEKIEMKNVASFLGWSRVSVISFRYDFASKNGDGRGRQMKLGG